MWVGPMLRRCARGRGDDATVYGFRERRGAWRERGRTHVCLCVYGTRAAAPNRSTPRPQRRLNSLRAIPRPAFGWYRTVQVIDFLLRNYALLCQ